jgi:hypothetical protein
MTSSLFPAEFAITFVRVANVGRRPPAGVNVTSRRTWCCAPRASASRTPTIGWSCRMKPTSSSAAAEGHV